MLEKIMSHMTVLYPILCYKKVCFKGTTLYFDVFGTFCSMFIALSSCPLFQV